MPASAPQTRFTFILEDIEACKSRSSRANGMVTYSDIFSSIIPRRSEGPSWGTTVLHTLPPIPCKEKHCKEAMVLHSIRTSWPAVLQIGPPDYAVAFPDQSHIDATTVISISSSSREAVQYKLVGCIRFHRTSEEDGTAANHFTCRFLHNTHAYVYNDMLHSGELKEIGGQDIFLENDRLATTLMYVRTSTASVRFSRLACCL